MSMAASIVFEVEGMSCNHCVSSIKNAVSELDGIERVDVDLNSKRVTVEYSVELIDIQTIRETIEDQGYEVVK